MCFQLQNQECVRAQIKHAEQEISLKLAEMLRRQEDPTQKQRTLVEEERHRYLSMQERVLTQLGYDSHARVHTRTHTHTHTHTHAHTHTHTHTHTWNHETWNLKFTFLWANKCLLFLIRSITAPFLTHNPVHTAVCKP